MNNGFFFQFNYVSIKIIILLTKGNHDNFKLKKLNK